MYAFRARRARPALSVAIPTGDEPVSELVISAETVQRYEVAGHPWLRGDYVHRILAGVRGRRVLDLLCSDGSNTVLLALRGAIVTGIDPSEDAVALARRRAEANGVADRAAFDVASVAALGILPPGSFDVIYGALVLHRVRDQFESVVPAVMRLGRPGATLVFVEPVSLWRWKRSLRQRLRPLRADAPPPLDAGDIDALRRLLPRVEVRYFGLFAVLLQRAGFAPVFERSNAAERLTYDVAGIIDQFLFRALRLRGLASSVVLVATLPLA